MSIIYDDGTAAVIDIGRAKAELRQVPQIRDEAARRAIIAGVNAAALLDIALSLRVLAAEAEAAMPPVMLEFEEEEEAASADFLVEGDRVSFEGGAHPDAIGTVSGLGYTEGELYAIVKWDDGTDDRVWVNRLTRVTPEPEPESEPEPEPGRPEDLVDDIDDDFDGDAHPEADAALEALKARAKATKKKGKK